MTHSAIAAPHNQMLLIKRTSSTDCRAIYSPFTSFYCFLFLLLLVLFCCHSHNRLFICMYVCTSLPWLLQSFITTVKQLPRKCRYANTHIILHALCLLYTKLIDKQTNIHTYNCKYVYTTLRMCSKIFIYTRICTNVGWYLCALPFWLFF